MTGSTISTRPTKITLAAAWLLAWTLASTAIALPDSTPEIELRFLEAGDDLILPAEGGWPLTLALTMNETKLLGIGGPPGTFPSQKQMGFFVFEDPDGCPSWDIPMMQEDFVSLRQAGLIDSEPYPSAYRECSDPPPLPWPRDEKLLEISPGRLALPAPDECSHLEILSFNFEDGTNTGRSHIGPCIGKDAYGPNPRLPGLVMVADHGPGIVTDELFNRSSPLRARNLAGFFESISYTLKDVRAKTSVIAHMNVPKALFAPIVQVDEEPGDWCGGGPGPIVRVDGGAASCVLDPFAVLYREATIRAFVVNGQAPDVLTDGNQDGVVDILDAEAADLQLLSEEAQIYFRLLHPETEPVLWPVFFFDLDGNGEAGVEPIPPAGPAELTNPPR